MYVTYDVHSEKQGVVLTASLYGEIDHHSATRLRLELDSVIIKERPSVLVMDVSNVAFMDSSGLGLIMGRLKKMQQTGGALVISEPNDDVLRILDMSGIGKYIRIVKKEKKRL